jgi:hypothetical protein
VAAASPGRAAGGPAGRALAPLDDASYSRSELAALIRIQYEERVAWKKQRKQKAPLPQVVGAGDFTGRSRHRPSVRALVQHLERGGDPDVGNLLLPPPMRLPGGRESSHSDTHNRDDDVRWQDHSIHRSDHDGRRFANPTKVAQDVFTPKRRVFSIPSTMKLNERNIVKIYEKNFGSRFTAYWKARSEQFVVPNDVTRLAAPGK